MLCRPNGSYSTMGFHIHFCYLLIFFLLHYAFMFDAVVGTALLLLLLLLQFKFNRHVTDNEWTAGLVYKRMRRYSARQWVIFEELGWCFLFKIYVVCGAYLNILSYGLYLYVNGYVSCCCLMSLVLI